mgnify:FL=1
MTPHLESDFAAEIDAFLQLLVLRNKPALELEDIRVLLQTMGSPWAGVFRPLRDLLQEVTVDEVPGRASEGLGTPKQIYKLRFADIDESAVPLLELFARHLAQVLDVWTADASVEVRLEGLPEEDA